MRLIGEWYRDNVLNHPEWDEVDLPHGPGEIRIEPQLFSYFLYHGKKFIEVETEEEARYFKAMLQAGRATVKIPKDREHLKQILPDLERLMRRTLEIIEERSAGILPESKRLKALDLFWYKAMKPGYEVEEKIDEERRQLEPITDDDPDEECEMEETADEDDDAPSDRTSPGRRAAVPAKKRRDRHTESLEFSSSEKSSR